MVTHGWVKADPAIGSAVTQLWVSRHQWFLLSSSSPKQVGGEFARVEDFFFFFLNAMYERSWT
jgi:hypothetical protein